MSAPKTKTPPSKAEMRVQIAKLRNSLREMLECYWGEGDGAPPPEFIRRAQRLLK